MALTYPIMGRAMAPQVRNDNLKKLTPSALLACLLSLLCILSASVNLIRWLQTQSAVPTLYDVVEALGWSFFTSVILSTLAALIISRQPRNRVGWLLMLPALVIATPTWYVLDSLGGPPEQITPLLWLAMWFDGWSWVPAIFPVFLIPLHFPTGSPPSPRWRWVNWLALGMALFFATASAFLDNMGPINEGWTVPNPIGLIDFAPIEDTFLIFWGIGLITMLAASVISLLLRYRRAKPVERQQIKWLLYAAALFLLVYAATYFLPDNEVYFGSGLFNLLFFLSVLSIPLAVAMAILRYRLWDIDIIIRKTLQYTILSLLLALIYFGSVVLLQSLFEAVSGQRSAVSIVLSTLVIAAVFSPLRRRLQATIDRRFFRNKYDVQLTLAHFAHTARDEVDLDELSAALLAAVQSTVQPETASLWLAKDRSRGA